MGMKKEWIRSEEEKQVKRIRLAQNRHLQQSNEVRSSLLIKFSKSIDNSFISDDHLSTNRTTFTRSSSHTC